ncbi:MAG: alpha/beta hydrolase [Sphingomonadaceae bacterium]
MWRLILGVIVGLAVSLTIFRYTVEPPQQLDIINSLTPGDDGVAQVAQGQVFDPKTGLKLDVWASTQATSKPRPVLIFFYGGGWAHGERAHYGFAAKAFAAQGFVVVVPDYRKVPTVRFPAFNQDGAAAIKWTRDNIAKFGGDPGRLALSGHSAGAYIAMILTLDRHYLTDIGVDPKIVRATVGLSGPYDFLPLDSRRSIDAMKAWPKPIETQPIAFATKDAPPIMVVTGTADDTVKPRNAILLAQALGKLGTKPVFKAYENLGHEDVVMALSKPFRGKAPVLADSVAFLKAHVRS